MAAQKGGVDIRIRQVHIEITIVHPSPPRHPRPQLRDPAPTCILGVPIVEPAALALELGGEIGAVGPGKAADVP
jgi:hypothetical protein